MNLCVCLNFSICRKSLKTMSRGEIMNWILHTNYLFSFTNVYLKGLVHSLYIFCTLCENVLAIYIYLSVFCVNVSTTYYWHKHWILYVFVTGLDCWPMCQWQGKGIIREKIAIFVFLMFAIMWNLWSLIPKHFSIPLLQILIQENIH